MNRFIGVLLLCAIFSYSTMAQKDTLLRIDTLQPMTLEEVVLIGQQQLQHRKTKLLSSLDGYLERNNYINMIKRGAYAWEPLLNGMATERAVITIDGMRIYGACTDKMDPITSYVEITNLSKAHIQSGQSGAANGATIAGSLDLVRRQSGFSNAGFSGMIFTGLETSNMQKIAGTALQYATNKFFADIDVTYRDANNYKAGGGEEVLYSQFIKYNIAATTGFKIKEHRQITGSVIYDRATDVGYPALPMDVSLAKAFIGSLQYEHHAPTAYIDHWETKLYYNAVTHIMDDSQRPIVPIRMDMPGWTKTAGFYSKMNGTKGKHQWKLNLNGHYNTSLAEMTMYANDPGEKDMFMLTWPGVRTFYGGIFLEDKLHLSDRWNALLTIGTGMNHHKVANELGLESLQIFYPGMRQAKTRILKTLSAKLNYQQQQWQYTLGAGYGERAPSVSEGYGFYLFNSFDRFDYIGNPGLKNEKSFELNAAAVFTGKFFTAKLNTDYFRIADYIIGMPAPNLLPMTIGANGIKIYEQLRAANIWNAGATLDYQLAKQLKWSAKAVYRVGRSGSLNLPLIQPFSYGSTLQYAHQTTIVAASVEGALQQSRYSPTFGETPAAAYTIFNLAASQLVQIGTQKITVKAGVENLLDRKYSTFADWNRIPRIGRNIFVNLVYGF